MADFIDAKISNVWFGLIKNEFTFFIDVKKENGTNQQFGGYSLKRKKVIDFLSKLLLLFKIYDINKLIGTKVRVFSDENGIYAISDGDNNNILYLPRRQFELIYQDGIGLIPKQNKEEFK